jgi:lipopolysaccharide transport system permease protein
LKEIIIKPTRPWWDIGWKELWAYRDLLMLFVRRDFVSVYKQTILGPLWFLIQPVLTTITFTVIFGNIAKVSTDGTPSLLFYMAGITIWTYFSECFTKTANSFTANAGVFGKVYFPRLISPLSVVVSNLFKLAIQFVLFMAFWCYYKWTGSDVHMHATALLLPLYVLLMAGIGLGLGLIISSVTTKYRDMKFLLSFGIQLFMYATPVVYPMSILEGTYKKLMFFNPIAHIMEAFKYSFTGKGSFDVMGLGYAAIFMVLVLLVGILVFNRVERTFMDTV